MIDDGRQIIRGRALAARDAAPRACSWGAARRPGGEVARARDRPPRPRLDQDELGLEHQMTAADALLVDEWAHIQEPLPAHDLAADDPIERAAVAQLLGALGHHARPVHVLGREPALPALLEFLADPVLEVLDRVAADAKLDEMKGHGWMLPNQL